MTQQHPLNGPSSRPRDESARLVTGRGRFIDTISLPGMLHAAFLRSDVARARLVGVCASKAQKQPGVVAVYQAADFAPLLARVPRATVDNAPSHVSPEQPPLAHEHIRYQGEPVAMVVAESHTAAHDALADIELSYESLPAVTRISQALQKSAPTIGEKDNVAFAAEIGSAVDMSKDVHRLDGLFSFARQTGVTLEPRGLVASYESVDDELTVYHCHQSPHLAQAVFAEVLGMPEHRVRVVVGDVGGGFGVKLHIYPDELATVLAARILGVPVKFCASRMESFAADCHAREFEVKASISLTQSGDIAGLEAEFTNALGAYSIYPRASISDAGLCGRLFGAPYRIGSMHAKTRSIWQNKTPAGAIRGVSQPIPCTVTEQLIDMAAHHLGEDPAAYRRRQYLSATDYPYTTLGGLQLERLSLVECLDTLLDVMRYDELRAEQNDLRASGRRCLRGIGIATFVEMTAPGAGLYASSGAPITAIDECHIRLEADASIRVQTGATDQGQGTLTGIRQVVAGILGTPIEQVRVVSSDSAGARGGGAWASRGLSLAGEAAALAASTLRDNILQLAAGLLQEHKEALVLQDGHIHDARDVRMGLREFARIAWYNPGVLPADAPDRLSLSRSYVLRDRPYLVANGVQASLADVDPQTGVVTLLKHWVVEDCGHVINPALVDGQLMGGIAQGIGAALLENSYYHESGQLYGASLLDYALPRAANVPPIEVHHISTAQTGTTLGIKGVGEAGTIGAPAAVWSAVNDALRDVNARVSAQPITSELVVAACGLHAKS